jgi:plastocyanin domain-containing protein
MSKITAITIIIAFTMGIGIVLLGQSEKSIDSMSEPTAQNVEIREGVQYITINAGGGYSPRVSTAEANIPTQLIVKTNGTYDCSAALLIRSIAYQKILPQTGEEIIDLGKPQAGTLQGICSMGMYNFSVNFQ